MPQRYEIRRCYHWNNKRTGEQVSKCSAISGNLSDWELVPSGGYGFWDNYTGTMHSHYNESREEVATRLRKICPDFEDISDAVD
jgi:hypothetical protein